MILGQWMDLEEIMNNNLTATPRPEMRKQVEDWEEMRGSFEIAGDDTLMIKG
jgi:hypothetical protein